MENSPKWHERDVPFSVFTWFAGAVLVIFGFVFSQIAVLRTTLDSLRGGQSEIKEQLIRMDERQVFNTNNIQKILTKLNVN